MKQSIWFDPLLFKKPKGPVVKGTEVSFSVCYENKPNAITMIFHNDDNSYYEEIEMKNINGKFFLCKKFETSGHFWYNFKVLTNDGEFYLNKTDDSYSALENFRGNDFFQAVLEEEYVCTNSMQGGMIYQIYVDRFCKVGKVKSREPFVLRKDWGGAIHKNTTNPILINQEVFGGNFKGVMSKLDYLKDLGVTIIYFNPISQASSNHKYDTGDYTKPDEMFGTEEEFKKLIDEADKRGIKIIIDGVYNHTGSDSIYFNRENRYNSVGAYNSQNSPYYSWYTFYEYPDKYESWWGIDTLPAIRGDCTEFQEFIAGDGGVIEKFMKLGVFGVRLDVVDEINDGFVKKISNKVKQFGKDRVIMGEVWEDAATKISYDFRRQYFVHNQLNSVMNYPIKVSILEYMKTKEPNTLVSTIRMLQNNYPKVVLDNLMNFLGTHDTNRIFTELNLITNFNKELSKKLLKICFVLIFTLQGVPSCFYGDEYAMENNDGSSRGCFDWENYNNDIYKFVKKLSKIRKLEALKDGELNIIYSENGKFVFERVGKRTHVVVLINLAQTKISFDVDKKFKRFFGEKKTTSLTLNENEFEILYEEK
ncbi:MAG: glycoside hydrolase family 13 protein [Clostridia bacterium]|nr:glycoside hydrolase family 13 protein [Clostridia bacterium]